MPAVTDVSQQLDVTAAMIRSAALVQDVCAAASGERGMTPHQAQLLCVVGDEPSSMMRLGSLLRIGKSAMTGLVDRAEHAGLVVRVVDPNDGRSRLIALTPRGRRANESYRRAVGERIDELIGTLSAPERDGLAAVLSRVVIDNEAPETWPEGEVK